jgi:ERCC4-type nuclease
MLLIDNRAGSKELVKPLTKILGENVVQSTTLDFGDVAFTGRGVKNAPLDIGIEFKQLGDIMQCCRDGRFSGHQLPGMRKTYDYSWLLIEGMWRHDETSGLITAYKGPHRGWATVPGKMRAAEFEKHLLTFELCGGVHVRYVNTRADSVRAIVELYRWWTDRALDSHTSHLAIHTPVTLGVISPFRQAVMAWPGVGLKFSKTLEKWAGRRVDVAATASVTQLSELETDGRRFGEANAAKLVKFLRGVK